MNHSTSFTGSKRSAFFRIPPVFVHELHRPVAMPAWRPADLPPREGVLILIGWSRGMIYRISSHAHARCRHANGTRSNSALCGARDWRELASPEETTCPACRSRLGRHALRPGIH